MISFSDAISVYTDASLIKVDKITSTCAGYALVYHNKILEEDRRILHNSTNNYGEIYAIYMGVQALLRYADTDCFLNLFSDSKISIDGLTSWISNWVRTQDSSGCLRSSSGAEVANQDIFKSIIGLIESSNIHLQMFHVLGHISVNKYNDLLKARATFKRENGVLLSEDIIREICIYNNYVDNMTRDFLMYEKRRLKTYAKPNLVISRSIDEYTVNKYLNLLKD